MKDVLYDFFVSTALRDIFDVIISFCAVYEVFFCVMR